MDRIILALEIVRHFDKTKYDGKTKIGKLVDSAISVLQKALDEPAVPEGQPMQPPILEPTPAQ